MSALMMKSRMAPVAQRNVAAKAGKTVNGKTVGGKTRSASGKQVTINEETREYVLSLPGITAPFNDVFDPAGLSAKASIEEIRRWRESEVTHGRVAMLAALGFVVGEQLEDFPAFMNFDGSITGPAINQFQQVQQGFWEPLLIAIGLAETYRVSLGWATPTGQGFNALKEEYNMGELNFDPLGIAPEDPEELKTMQTKELNNGRLAMIAIAGFVVQECVDQTEIFEHLFVEAVDEVVREIDDIERDIGLPVTPVPFPGF